jgi:hypothetical protein
MTRNESLIPIERIEQKIYVIRGERVILDSDLASIYGVTTTRFNEAIKRNSNRFPGDFIFQLTADEHEALKSHIAISNNEGSLTSQNATSKKGRGGRRYLPYVFTEHGALMAANVVKSDQAVDASVQVVRAFVKMRTMLASHTELSKKINDLEKKYDSQFKSVFEAIKRLMLPPVKPRGGIGFVETSKKKK